MEEQPTTPPTLQPTPVPTPPDMPPAPRAWWRQTHFAVAAAAVAVLLLMGTGLWLLSGNSPKTPSQTSHTAYVAITPKGFSPQSITVTPGTNVVWVDQDPAPHLPAADPYPTHTSLPSLVAPRALGKGQSYSYRFAKTGTVHYHDDLHPMLSGEVIVR